MRLRGGAIDFARYSNAKRQTTTALDTAVLAGARTLLLTGYPGRAKAAVKKYDNEKIASRIAIDSDTISFSVSDNNTVATGSDTAFPPTTLLKPEDTSKSCGTSINHFCNTLEPVERRSAVRDMAAKLSTTALAR